MAVGGKAAVGRLASPVENRLWLGSNGTSSLFILGNPAVAAKSEREPISSQAQHLVQLFLETRLREQGPQFYDLYR